MGRFDFIDVAKGMGILMVVWAHILLVGPSHELIYAFHMPLFFFISGMLFKKDKYASFDQFLKQRAKRLFVPYVLYSVGTWCVWAVFRYVSHAEVDSYFMPLLQTIIAQGSGAYMVHNSALWFIPCLFAVEIIFYFFCKANKFITLCLCILTAGMGVCLTKLYSTDYLYLLPWNLDAAFFALPFYGFANIFCSEYPIKKIVVMVTDNLILSILLVVISFSIMTYLSMEYKECSMGSSSYNCPLWVFFIRAFLGCIGLVVLSVCICTLTSRGGGKIYNFIKYCGLYSLDIMCLHIPIKGVAIIVVAKVFTLTVDVQASLLYSMLTFGLTLIVMIPIVYIINKYIKGINIASFANRNKV